MNQMVIRAWLAKQMGWPEMLRIREGERKIFGCEKTGRCLTGFEIVRLLGQKVKNPSELEAQSLWKMFLDYEHKELWKRQQIEEIKHERECSPTGKCGCASKLDEIYAWEDYVTKEPRVDASLSVF